MKTKWRKSHHSPCWFEPAVGRQRWRAIDYTILQQVWALEWMQLDQTDLYSRGTPVSVGVGLTVASLRPMNEYVYTTSMCIQNDFTGTIGSSSGLSINIRIVSLSLSTECRSVGTLHQHFLHMFHKLDSTSEWNERLAELCGNSFLMIANNAPASVLCWKGIFPVRNSCWMCFRQTR